MNKRLIFQTIITIVLLHIFSTQDFYAQPRVITMEQAIAFSVKNNHDVQASRLDVLKAREAVREAFGTALPSLNLSATYTRNLIKPVFFFPNVFSSSLPFDQFPFLRDSARYNQWIRMRDSMAASGGEESLQKVEVGQNNSFQIAASVNQMVFNSAVFTAIGTARIYQDAASESLKATIMKTINNTRKAYYGALLAREALRTLQASYEKGQENVQMVRTLYTEGVIPEFDQIRAEVSVENIQPAVLQAQTGYINALNALKVSMGLDMSDSIDVDGDLIMPVSDEDLDEETIMSRIMESNYDLRALEIQKRVNEDIISLRKSEYYPIVTLSGSYVYQGQSNTFDFITAQSAGVSLNFSLNLFSGFQTSARVEQARIDYMTMDERLQQLKEAIQLQVKNYILQIQVAKKRIEAQQRTVTQAERGYQIAQIRYREGIGNQTEINESDIALRQSRTNRAQAVHDYLVARSELDALIGSVSSEYIGSIEK